MILHALFFYLFAGVCVASAFMVIAARNPVQMKAKRTSVLDPSSRYAAPRLRRLRMTRSRGSAGSG